VKRESQRRFSQLSKEPQGLTIEMWQSDCVQSIFGDSTARQGVCSYLIPLPVSVHPCITHVSLVQGAHAHGLQLLYLRLIGERVNDTTLQDNSADSESKRDYTNAQGKYQLKAKMKVNNENKKELPVVVHRPATTGSCSACEFHHTVSYNT
jgi:hypothetical protein